MARTRKKPEDDSSKAEKAKQPSKKKASLRERNIKAAEAKDKPKRMRKAATQAKKPVSGLAHLLTKEFHLFPQKDEAGFFTRSRSAAPRYFLESLAELKYVTWPGRRETWKLVFAVFVFAIILGGFIAVLDFGLEQLFKNVILQS